jgi:hypothetical protein
MVKSRERQYVHSFDGDPLEERDWDGKLLLEWDGCWGKLVCEYVKGNYFTQEPVLGSLFIIIAELSYYIMRLLVNQCVKVITQPLITTQCIRELL